MDLRGARGGFHRRVIGVGPGEPDVVADGGTQQVGVLEDEGHLPVQLGRGEFAHVGAADPHRSVCDVPEAGHEPGQGGLPGAGRAHQGGDGAGPQGQVDAGEDLGGVVVSEADAGQLDQARLSEGLGCGCLGQRRGGQQRVEAAGTLHAALDGVPGLGEPHHRAGEGRAEQHERHDVDGVGPALGDEEGARSGRDEQGGRARQGEAGGSAGPRRAHDPVAEEDGEAVGRVVVGAVGAGGAAVCLDDGDAVHELYDGGVDASHRGEEPARHLLAAGHGRPARAASPR